MRWKGAQALLPSASPSSCCFYPLTFNIPRSFSLNPNLTCSHTCSRPPGLIRQHLPDRQVWLPSFLISPCVQIPPHSSCSLLFPSSPLLLSVRGCVDTDLEMVPGMAGQEAPGSRFHMPGARQTLCPCLRRSWPWLGEGKQAAGCNGKLLSPYLFWSWHVHVCPELR